MRAVTGAAPWTATLTGSERSLILYFLVVAGLAMLATLLRGWIARSEVSARYRPAVTAGIGVTAAAFLTYVLLAVAFLLGYERHGAGFAPNDAAIWSWAPRYMDWSVTVPLIVAQLVAVSALPPRLHRPMRLIGMTAAFLMILTGYLGGVVVDDGSSFAALAGFGALSTVCFAVVYAIVIVTVVKSLPGLPAGARPVYRDAMILLIVVWFAYPVVFGLQGVASGGGWLVAAQIVLCCADVFAKTVYIGLILKVARLRTAADVAAGEDVFPEPVWVDQVKQSEAR